MRILGFSIEDWVALAGIIATTCSLLTWSFKTSFHKVYEEEASKDKNKFRRLIESFDDFKDTQKALNKTMQDIKDDLNKNNSKLTNHEIRLAQLEVKEGMKIGGNVNDDEED